MTDAKIPYPPTPELDKQLDIIKSGKTAVVQEFIDWFLDQGLHLTKYEVRSFEGEPCPGWGMSPCKDGRIQAKTHGEKVCPNCKGSGRVAVEREGHYDDGRAPEQLMADFFGIDRDKIEAERRAILEAIRS